MTDLEARARELLADGQTYLNRRGDLRGPMRFVPQTYSSGYFIDQYGTQFYPDGTEVGHVPKSTANIDISTAGADPEFEAACKREEDDRDDEAALHREAALAKGHGDEERASDEDIERQARELLAGEFEASGRADIAIDVRRGRAEGHCTPLWMDESLRAIIAALSSAEPHPISPANLGVGEGGGWQPIETAPKDGKVLLYWPPVKDLPEHVAIADHRGGPFRHPTHWQPLPAPPAIRNLVSEQKK